jgi:Ser/Thr protein kinase RdoA (MazF antagonist)
MEKRIKERYSDQILQQAMQSFNIEDGHIHLLDGFESFIYEFDRQEASFILRIGHSLRRSENLIRGEVDWINYLYQGGASVAKAILAVNGELVAPVEDGHSGHFLATAFEKADGKPPGNDQWGEALYERYGRLLGRMHALAKTYVPKDLAWKRPEWDDPEMLDIESWLPDSESLVLGKYRILKAHLDSLPRSRESYGLIHQDAHGGNLFVDDGGKITLFDFDDCTYSWFINDIAIVLFYIVMGVEDQAAFTKNFMTHFLSGYRAENQLDEEWLGEIPSFLKLREIDLYAVIHRSFDIENIDHPWVEMFMKDRKTRIENDVPFIDFDFETYSET